MRAKINAAGDQNEHQLYYTSATDRFAFLVSSNGTNFTTVTADNFGSPSTGTWYFVVAWHDAAANTINIQVNNGTVNSASWSSGVFDSTAAFRIGYRTDGVHLWDGLIDEVSFWKRVLTSDEKTALYNGGSGLAFPWMTAVQSVSPSDNSTDVSVTSNLILTFDQTTRAGTGTLSIKRTSDNATVETITVSGSQLSGNDSTQLTLNPSVTLSGSTSYYVTWTANAFKSTFGNYVAAQTSTAP